MRELQKQDTRGVGGLSNWQRTRRNILAIGGILGGAMFAGAKSAKADDDWDWDPFRHHHHHDHCFLRGTRVLTPCGERRVEDLEIDDAIITLRGESRIQWIGRRLSLRKANKASWANEILPVRFSRGAVGPNLPHSDLWVSQEHALLIDGVSIRAVELANGKSIAIDFCENANELEYLHIKVADPSFIFAEGLPSETLVFSNVFDIGGFDNIEEYQRLYGSAEIAGSRDVIALGRRDRIKSHLRSALSPWIDRRTEFDKVRDRLQERADELAA
jgi:Hint domain